jgi:hypothetical protein
MHRKSDPLELTPRQRQIYELLKVRPRTRQQLWIMLYENVPGDGPGEKIIYVLVNQLNKRLKPYGSAIRSERRGPYLGTYYLTGAEHADPVRKSA